MTEAEMKDAAISFIYEAADYEYMDLFDYLDTGDETVVKRVAELIASANIEVSW
jgi:hypothetical protein